MVSTHTMVYIGVLLCGMVSTHTMVYIGVLLCGMVSTHTMVYIGVLLCLDPLPRFMSIQDPQDMRYPLHMYSFCLVTNTEQYLTICTPYSGIYIYIYICMYTV